MRARKGRINNIARDLTGPGGGGSSGKTAGKNRHSSPHRESQIARPSLSLQSEYERQQRLLQDRRAPDPDVRTLLYDQHN